jgi:hypothetical protein
MADEIMVLAAEFFRPLEADFPLSFAAVWRKARRVAGRLVARARQRAWRWLRAAFRARRLVDSQPQQAGQRFQILIRLSMLAWKVKRTIAD